MPHYREVLIDMVNSTWDQFSPPYAHTVSTCPFALMSLTYQVPLRWPGTFQSTVAMMCRVDPPGGTVTLAIDWMSLPRPARSLTHREREICRA